MVLYGILSTDCTIFGLKQSSDTLLVRCVHANAVVVLGWINTSLTLEGAPPISLKMRHHPTRWLDE